MKTLYCTISLLLTLVCTSCDGAFSGIYDDPPQDTSFTEGLTRAGGDSERFILQLDATGYDQWIYINISDGAITRESIPTSLVDGEIWDGHSGRVYHIVEGDRYTQVSFTRTSTQPEPDKWDFALHHFDARTNGAGVCETQYTSLDQLPSDISSFSSSQFTPDQWTDNVAMVDLREMMGYKIGYQSCRLNRVLSGWVEMDFSNPPPVYSATGHVYLLRYPDGRTVALQMKSYMSDRGSKGYLTIEGLVIN